MKAEPDRLVAGDRAFPDVADAAGLAAFTEQPDHVHDVAGVTGEQGSGILRSMSEANCFIILPTDQGNVTPGTLVEVQAMESVI